MPPFYYNPLTLAGALDGCACTSRAAVYLCVGYVVCWMYPGLSQPAEVFSPAALEASHSCGLFPPSADVGLEPPADAPLTNLREKGIEGMREGRYID